MPNIADNDRLKIFLRQDLLQAQADVIVISQSTDGQVGNNFQKFIEQEGFYPGRNNHLGDVDPRGLVNTHASFKYLVYVVTDSPVGTNYSAIRNIGIKLGKFANENADVQTIACGVIGAEPGELRDIECIKIFGKAFLENSSKELRIHTNNQALFESVEQINISEFNTTSSAKYTFIVSVKRSFGHTAIVPIVNNHDFYYHLAKVKFDEYLTYDAESSDFFSDLHENFKNKWSSGFVETINRFTEGSSQHTFLKLCGELVAYLDYNAANKNQWNQYTDKRTIAKSHVNQFDWISNLIHFRIKNDYLGTAPNVANAIKFLINPGAKLSMLSNRHRAFLLKNIYNSNYFNDDDLEIIFNQFSLWGIKSGNPINTGTLITRILYLDEVEELWNMEPVLTRDEIADKIFPGNLEDAVYDNANIENRKTIESTFLTDYYAETDLLNYELYASAIVAFINHKNTKPPLTIGIMAPWGKGKTSLMHFIEKKLKAFESLPPQIINENDTTLKKEKTATFGLFRKWIDKAKDKFVYNKTLQYPTVWFNAWKFQKNEQIWAGFAYEIIHQLVNQLPNTLAQEEFWLRLNLKRIDQEKLKQKLRLKIYSKLYKSIVGFLLGFFIIFFMDMFHLRQFALLSGGVVTIGSIVSFVLSKRKVSEEKVDFDITKFIKQPDYSSKRGYFHEVEEDLREVMNLLVADGKPAVIFIDDLDRCSPNIVAEVVEAINLFISGDFPQCYFILGQDAQMVAASLDAAYNQVSDKNTSIYREQGSMGWHFMEKFIQLQFCIPVLNDEQAKLFFKNFFSTKTTGVGENENLELKEQVSKLEKKIDSGEKIGNLLTPATLQLEESLKMTDPKKAIQLQEKIIDAAAAQYDDNDPDVLKLIEHLSFYLGTSPRAIKRFINLYRFYKFLQLTNRNLLIQETSSIHLGQWIITMVRWPQLVRAIQWRTDEFINGSTALERAESFEKLIFQHENYGEWIEFVESNTPQVKWLKDFDLYNFMRIIKKDKNSLGNAVKMGIW